jgi:hypothetical protein
MTVLAVRGAGTSSPVRITSASGLAGIDQLVWVSGGFPTIRLRGRVVSGEAELLVFWRVGSRPAQLQQPLTFPNGSQRLRVALPRSPQPTQVLVALVQLKRNAVLELDRVALESRGEQLMQNAGLSFEICPSTANRPKPASALSGWLRSTTTVLLLGCIAVPLIGATRRRAKQ